MKSNLLFLICFPLIAILSPSLAQSSLDSLSYQVGLSLSGSRISGTFTRITLVGGLETHLNSSKFTLHNSLSYRFNNTQGRVIEDNWYDLFTLFYYPDEKKRWYPAVFYHYDNNLIFRVNSRHRFGGGIGSIPVDNGTVFLRVATGWAHEFTNYNGDTFFNSDLDMAKRDNGIFLIRINNDYSLLKQRLLLKVDLFYMQSLKEASDYDIWFRPSVQVRLNKAISFFVNYDFRFENVYLEAISPANDVLLGGLKFSLSNQ